MESELRQRLKLELRKSEEQLIRLRKALQAERRSSINADKLAARIAAAETRDYKKYLLYFKDKQQLYDNYNKSMISKYTISRFYSVVFSKQLAIHLQ